MRLTKTKIVCTLGPASSSEDVLRAMLREGMDCARLNFSHGTAEEKRQLVALLRRLGVESGHQLAIVCDIQGPKIRVGKVSAPFTLKEGQTTRVTPSKIIGDANRFQITVSTLLTDLHPGDSIFVNDGIVRLEVTAVEQEDLVCRVTAGGDVSDHKGCNIPNAKLSLSILTEKDKNDLKVIGQLDVDYVAVSFVSTASDMEEVRAYWKTVSNNSVKLIAKIERPVALENLEEIVRASDAVMVARGDLGVEIDLWQVPVWQREIIRVCRANAVPSIVATQMLTSMVTNSRPTRAETTDVFEAVMQGTHAVMMSEESSVGHDPAKVVFTMEKIIREAERLVDASPVSGFAPSPSSLCKYADALAPAVYGIAAACAARSRPSTIINVSGHTGQVARVLACMRLPQSILTFTESVKTMQSLAVVYGIRAILLPKGLDMRKDAAPRAETTFFEAIRIAHGMGLLATDALAIVASSSAVEDGFQVSCYPVAQVLALIQKNASE